MPGLHGATKVTALNAMWKTRRPLKDSPTKAAVIPAGHSKGHAAFSTGRWSAAILDARVDPWISGEEKQERPKENMTCERLITAQAFSDSSKDNSLLARQQRPRQLWSLLNPAFTLCSLVAVFSADKAEVFSSSSRSQSFPPPLYLSICPSLPVNAFLANANDSPAVQFRMNFPSLWGWWKGNRQRNLDSFTTQKCFFTRRSRRRQAMTDLLHGGIWSRSVCSVCWEEWHVKSVDNFWKLESRFSSVWEEDEWFLYYCFRGCIEINWEDCKVHI